MDCVDGAPRARCWLEGRTLKSRKWSDILGPCARGGTSEVATHHSASTRPPSMPPMPGAAIFAVLCQLGLSTSTFSVAPPPSPPPFQLHWANVAIDHFHWQKDGAAAAGSFPMRYFVLDSHWDRASGGPILFYTGK
jgi:hypothetical protein